MRELRRSRLQAPGTARTRGSNRFRSSRRLSRHDEYPFSLGNTHGVSEMAENVVRTGTIEEILAGGFFRIRCEDGTLVLAKPKGRLRRQAYRLMVGDPVDVEMAHNDLSTGLISEVHRGA
jgi:translation initiation factor IF-1